MVARVVELVVVVVLTATTLVIRVVIVVVVKVVVVVVVDQVRMPSPRPAAPGVNLQAAHQEAFDDSVEARY